MENKLIVPQDVYNRIEADALAWSENQYGHDDVNKDYLEGALHEAMIAQAEYVRLKAQPGPQWVKASERLPEKGGKENSVIVRGVFKEPGYNEWPFVAYGFRNFHPEKQEMYFELGSKSYLTNDVEWLDEQPAAGREEDLKAQVEKLTDALESIANGAPPANNDEAWSWIGTARLLAEEALMRGKEGRP